MVNPKTVRTTTSSHKDFITITMIKFGILSQQVISSKSLQNVMDVHGFFFLDEKFAVGDTQEQSAFTKSKGQCSELGHSCLVKTMPGYIMAGAEGQTAIEVLLMCDSTQEGQKLFLFHGKLTQNSLCQSCWSWSFFHGSQNQLLANAPHDKWSYNLKHTAQDKTVILERK